MPIGRTPALEPTLTPAGDPIMTSKFLVPVLNAPVLDRPRLNQRLTTAAAGTFTLISAPAGLGQDRPGQFVGAGPGAAPGPSRVDYSWTPETHLPGLFWTSSS